MTHLSLFEVVEDVLCVLWTHVTVLWVFRVNVKFRWDLNKSNSNKVCLWQYSSQKCSFKLGSFLTCCFRRCAGTSWAVEGLAAASSSTGVATSLRASSSTSDFSFEATAPSELTDKDLQRNGGWTLKTWQNQKEGDFFQSERNALFQIGLILCAHRARDCFLHRLLCWFFLPSWKAELNLMSLWTKLGQKRYKTKSGYFLRIMNKCRHSTWSYNKVHSSGTHLYATLLFSQL